MERAFYDLSRAGPSSLSVDEEDACAVAAAADEADLCKRQKQLRDDEELARSMDQPHAASPAQPADTAAPVATMAAVSTHAPPHCSLRVTETSEEIPAQNSRRWHVSATPPRHGGTTAGTACCAGRKCTQITAGPISGRSAGGRTCCPGPGRWNDRDSACPNRGCYRGSACPGPHTSHRVPWAHGRRSSAPGSIVLGSKGPGVRAPVAAPAAALENPLQRPLQRLRKCPRQRP